MADNWLFFANSPSAVASAQRYLRVVLELSAWSSVCSTTLRSWRGGSHGLTRRRRNAHSSAHVSWAVRTRLRFLGHQFSRRGRPKGDVGAAAPAGRCGRSPHSLQHARSMRLPGAFRDGAGSANAIAVRERIPIEGVARARRSSRSYGARRLRRAAAHQRPLWPSFCGRFAMVTLTLRMLARLGVYLQGGWRWEQR